VPAAGISVAHEIRRILTALEPVASAAPPARPASLLRVQHALESAWSAWRETDLATHAKLGAHWWGAGEAPCLFGLADRLASLWIETLGHVFDVSHVPHDAEASLLAFPPLIDKMRSLELDGHPSEMCAYFLSCPEANPGASVGAGTDAGAGVGAGAGAGAGVSAVSGGPLPPAYLAQPLPYRRDIEQHIEPLD
jgi:hypothetical protein